MRRIRGSLIHETYMRLIPELCVLVRVCRRRVKSSQAYPRRLPACGQRTSIGARRLVAPLPSRARKISERDPLSRLRRDLDHSKRLVELYHLNGSVFTECIG